MAEFLRLLDELVLLSAARGGAGAYRRYRYQSRIDGDLVNSYDTRIAAVKDKLAAWAAERGA